MKWKGVMPAITTCFDENLKVDHDFMARHCLWLLENGCTGIVLLGSLGEGATLSFEEKLQIVRTCVKTVRGRAPIVASISNTVPRFVQLIKLAQTEVGMGNSQVRPPRLQLAGVAAPPANGEQPGFKHEIV